MKDNLFIFAPVTFIKRQNNLCENSPNEILVDIVWTLRGATFLDQFPKITAFTALHDQVDRGVLFIDKFIKAADYVLVLELSQNVDFID